MRLPHGLPVSPDLPALHPNGAHVPVAEKFFERFGKAQFIEASNVRARIDSQEAMRITIERVEIPTERLFELRIECRLDAMIAQVPDFKRHGSITLERLPERNLILNRMRCQNGKHQTRSSKICCQRSP